MPLTSSFAGLALVGGLMGVGNGMGSGIVMTLGADLAPPDGRAAFLGAWRLVSDAGQAGGPLIAAAATAVATLGVASASIGLLGFVGVATFAVFLPSRPEAMTGSSH
jgi:MFS family permease